MVDTLLHFPDEAAAIAALAGHHGEGGWSGQFLPVALVTAEAEYGEPGDDDLPVLVTERQTRPGFWLLSCAEDFDPPAEAIAGTIERETGRLLTGDESLGGLRIDPVWAGAEPILSIGGDAPPAEL